MIKFLKKLFHNHDWEITEQVRGKATMCQGSKNLGKHTVFVETHKCSVCGVVRGGIRGIDGFDEYDYYYIKDLLENR